MHRRCFDFSTIQVRRLNLVERRCVSNDENESETMLPLPRLHNGETWESLNLINSWRNVVLGCPRSHRPSRISRRDFLPIGFRMIRRPQIAKRYNAAATPRRSRSCVEIERRDASYGLSCYGSITYSKLENRFCAWAKLLRRFSSSRVNQKGNFLWNCNIEMVITDCYI